MDNKVIGIIPARGGSKGVKRKNIRLVGGQPLIYWSIKAAQESSLLTDFYVTTDDQEIASVAEKFGAKVILRPESLAADNTPMIPVLQYICTRVEELSGKLDTVVLLQPTAPMRTGQNIDSAIELFHRTKGESRSLVSVYQVDDCHPSRMYRIANNTLGKLYSEPKGSLRQDLEPIFHRNGALYICERDLLQEESLLTCASPMPYIMSKADSANIDDEEDLKIADFLMTERMK